MQGGKVAGLVGDLASVEAAFSLKTLVEGWAVRWNAAPTARRLPAGNRSGYVGNAVIEDIDTAASILLIGTNPRDEAAVLNARLRRAWARGVQVTVVGPAVDLTFDYDHAGTDRAALSALLDKAEQSEDAGIIIIGQGALREAAGEAVLAAAQALAQATGARLLVLHTAAGRVGAMDVGAVTEGGMSAAIDGAQVIFNLGADEVEIAAGPVVIYQGSHGDRGAHRADIILPAACYTEEMGLFVNTEGRPQLAMRANFAPGEAKENWAILRALSAELGQTLPWDSLAQLRRALVEAVPHLGQVDQVVESDWQPLPMRDLGQAAFVNPIRDFYLTNPIARSSPLMGELSRMAAARHMPALAAE